MLLAEFFEDVDHLLHLNHKWILDCSKIKSCEQHKKLQLINLSLELLYPALSSIIDKIDDCLSKVFAAP